VRRALEQLGYGVRIAEWFQSEPPGERGTFSAEVDVRDIGITDQIYALVERYINDTKPLSRHLAGLSISLAVRAEIPVSVGCFDGEDITVFAYAPSAIQVSAQGTAAGIDHTIDTMTIYP
jgi:P2-related tail formation protein